MSFIDDEKKADDYLKKVNKKRDERKELKENTQYRKQCAAVKLKNILHLPFITLYDTNKLNTHQRLVILQLLRRIGECEGEIPKEYWCEDCKNKDERVKELIMRFQLTKEKIKKKFGF